MWLTIGTPKMVTSNPSRGETDVNQYMHVCQFER